MASSGHAQQSPDQQQKSKNALGVLLIVCFSIFFAVLNASAIGVVLPEMAVDLDVGFNDLGWVMTGFLLVYGVAIPFYGRLADLHGARRLFILGVALFSIGSLLAALSSTFELLLVARVIQALGGAAVPGLGMTLASRAYGPESRGVVLGVIGATVGIGGAIGPLVGGALSNVWAWEAVFAFTALSAAAIPFSLKILPSDEEIEGGHLDIIGGVLLAIAVIGILVAPTEAAKSGWGSTYALGGIGIAVVALLAMVRHQRSASEPFIPNEFIQNRRFNALVSMSFLVMATNMAPLIGLPIMLALVNDLSAMEIGIVLLPGAILTALTGVLSGKLVDSVGTQTLARLGGMIMLIAIVGFSGIAGDSEWKISIFAGLMGAGFGLINTPLATAVTRVVEPRLLGSALGVNSMSFFIGGSLGTAILLGFSTSDATSSLNPLHDGAASGFSDGFLFLAIPIIAVLLLTSKLPGRAPETEQPHQSRAIHEWRGDCSVGWSPDLELESPTSELSS